MQLPTYNPWFMQMFENISGNERAKQVLLRMIQNEQLVGTFIFSGQDSSDKHLFANTIAEYVSAPADIRLFSPEGKSAMHPTEQMSRFIEDIQISPFQSKIKSFIFTNAERMLPAASNRLLKTLEEPPEHALIILLTSKLSEMLPTIVSRARIITFSSKSKDRALPEIIPLITQFYSRDISAFYAALQTLDDTQDGQELLDALFSWYRDLHLLKNQGDEKELTYPKQTLLQHQDMPLPTLDTIHQATKQASLALSRSMRLKSALEGFFFSL